MTQPNEATGTRPAKTDPVTPEGTAGEVDAKALADQSKKDRENHVKGNIMRDANADFGGESFSYGGPADAAPADDAK